MRASIHHLFPLDQNFRTKYGIVGLPDDDFMRMAADAIAQPDLKKIEDLTAYVQEKMGGFVLDGWTLRVPV